MPVTLKRALFASALLAGSLGFVSCASGPSYAEAKSTLPAVAKGHSRVFIYRPSSFGAAIKPSVKIDGTAVGTSEGQGFIYSDQKPGQHVVSMSTEWTHKATITVKPGESAFVRSKVRPGLIAGHIIPEQVDKATGEQEIQDCKLSAE
ncbi:MAG: DUF2846 domain-containing protein [Akkermansiaceae bacterium]|nr:DUF2846 domain-containing protein [Akkermansiaceae bacterium]